MNISKGVLQMLWAAFLFTIMNACVKAIPNIPPVEIVLFRSIISFGLCWFSLKKMRISIWGNNKKILIARGAFGAVSLMMFFAVIQNMPLASAAVIHYTAPIFTALIAYFVLGEKIFRIQWLFFALCFAGVIIVKGFDARVDTLYLGMGIASAALAAAAYNCIRKLKTSEHPLVIVFYFPLVTLPIAGLISVFNWVTPQGTDWLFLLGIGVLTQMAQVAMTKAYQQEAAAKVASVTYTGIIYALSLGFIFFNESFNWMVLGGMALILIGVILNVSFKQLGRNVSKQ